MAMGDASAADEWQWELMRYPVEESSTALIRED